MLINTYDQNKGLHKYYRSGSSSIWFLFYFITNYLAFIDFHFSFLRGGGEKFKNMF